MTYEIHHSARKHGVTDEDILHAIDYALVVLDYEDDDRMLYLGPTNPPTCSRSSRSPKPKPSS